MAARVTGNLLSFNILSDNTIVRVIHVDSNWTVRQLKTHLIAQQITKKPEEAQMLHYGKLRLINCFILSQLLPPLNDESTLSLSIVRVKKSTILLDASTEKGDASEDNAYEKIGRKTLEMMLAFERCSMNNETVDDTVRTIANASVPSDGLLAIMAEHLTMQEAILMAKRNLTPLDRIHPKLRAYYVQNPTAIAIHIQLLVQGFSEVFDRMYLSEELFTLMTDEARLANLEDRGLFSKAAADLVRAHAAKLFGHFVDSSKTRLSKNMHGWIMQFSKAMKQAFSILLQNGQRDFDKILPCCLSLNISTSAILKYPAMAKVAELLLRTATNLSL